MQLCEENQPLGFCDVKKDWADWGFEMAEASLVGIMNALARAEEVGHSVVNG